MKLCQCKRNITVVNVRSVKTSEIILADRCIPQTIGRHGEAVNFTTYGYNERDGGGRPKTLYLCSLKPNIVWAVSASAISYFST